MINIDCRKYYICNYRFILLNYNFLLFFSASSSKLMAKVKEYCVLNGIFIFFMDIKDFLYCDFSKFLNGKFYVLCSNNLNMLVNLIKVDKAISASKILFLLNYNFLNFYEISKLVTILNFVDEGFFYKYFNICCQNIYYFLRFLFWFLFYIYK